MIMGFFLSLNQFGSPEGVTGGERSSAGTVYPLLEKLNRVIVGLTLNILRKGKTDRSGVGGIGKDPHGINGGDHKLIGPADSVKIPANGLESVVGGDSIVIGYFDLLQHPDRADDRRRCPREERVRESCLP